MKNKLCYADEMTNRVLYIVFAVFLGIIIFIMLFLFLVVGVEFYKLSYIFGLFFIFFLFEYLTLFLVDKSRESARIEYRYIKENGKRVDGNIVKTCTHNYREEDSVEDFYTVVVEYKNPKDNSIVTFETPSLSFVPYDKLGSKKCSVYVLDDRVYVTDFVEKARGEKSVFQLEDKAKNSKKYRKSKKNKSIFLIFGFVFLCIFLIFMFLIFKIFSVL